MPLMPAVLGSARLGNFRLGYVPTALADVRETRVTILIGGVLANHRVRRTGLSIHDALNEAPNTCSLTVDGTAPTPGQDLRVSLNSNAPQLLFNGTFQTVDLSYEGLPNQHAWRCQAVDDLARLNRKRPFGTFVNVSATTIAQSLIADFAPGFTSTHVEAGLPLVSIIFDGSASFSGCLAQLARLIGGYFYVEDLDLHFFLTEATDTPDPIARTSPYADLVLADGAIGYWRLGEASGTVAEDSSPSGLDGTISGGVTLGQAGALSDGDTAALFNGSTGTVDLGAGAFDFGAAFTVEAFFATTNASGTPDVIAGKTSSATLGGWVLLMQSGHLRFWGYTAGGGAQVFDLATAAAINDGAFHHVVAAWDGTMSANAVQVWVDGVLAAQQTAFAGTPSNGAIAARIGSTGDGVWFFNGTIDEVALYPTALTAPQIAAHYALRTAGLTYGGLLNDPPIRASYDDSQLRNKLFGKGHGETTLSDVAAGETIVPIVDAVMFNPAGGQAIAGTTPDGAQSQILEYAGTILGGSGSLVGPGVLPTGAPAITMRGGSAGLTFDLYYGYAYTFVTGAGESLPSPVAAVTFPTVSAPTEIPTITASGSPFGMTPGAVYKWRVTYSTTAAVGGTPSVPETAVGLTSLPYTATASGSAGFKLLDPVPAWVQAVNVYRTLANGSTYYFELVAPNTGQLSGGGYLVGLSDAVIVTQAAAPSSASFTAPQGGIAGIALGPSGTTQRKVYRTTGQTTEAAALTAQLKLQQTIANNTTTNGVQDATVDGSLGANVPTGDTSGLTPVAGQVNAGSTSLLTAGWAFATAGWVRIGQQLVRYSGLTGNTLTGIPASGSGALVSTVKYGEQVDVAPALIGVTGNALAMLKGTPVHIWVQRDDLAAQAALIALDAAQGRTSDGVVEHTITDARRGEASLIALCDADLALFSYPIVTVTYATRDPKTKSGKPIVFNLTSPLINETLTIQSVDITEIDIVPGLNPRFSVTASSVRFSLEDVLRQLISRQAAA